MVREKANIVEYKEMYNERLWVINQYLKIHIYPSWHELFLYENKRMYSYFFETHGVSTPSTHVFYSKDYAIEFCKKAQYPLVFKTNGGAGGSGVTIVRSNNKAKRMINSIFGRINPRMALGHCHWVKYGRVVPVPKLGMSQRHYVIVQEYIDVEIEWRIIKLGDTYAGYKRPMENGLGLCELLEYGFPPKPLLHLIKEIAEENHFDSLSLDVLLGKDGKFYVTEMQSLFGCWTPHQCEVNGIGGKIEFRENDFVFVEGEDFFKWNGNLIRVRDFIQKLKSHYFDNLSI